jgi:probable O-glycosylation ligase (exosortase A-associated)
MNPHRLAWGFAYDMPFAAMIGICTLVGLLFSKDLRKPIPWSGTLLVWGLLIFWLTFSTFFSVAPDEGWMLWNRAMKIQLFALLSVILMQSRLRIDALVWIIVLSLGFFGTKGGIFAALTGGGEKVFGPPDSFIADNNALALALIMAIPLIRYLQVTATQKWVRLGLLASMPLMLAAVLASQSRGALLASIAMSGYMVIKTKNKVWFGILMIVGLPLLFVAMPESWTNRMMTIGEYQSDGSAQGRINAWWYAFNLAKDHPFVGGGFGAFQPELFKRYAPNPDDFHAAHSIYFEVLGQQGFVGLALFLLLGFLAFRTAGKLISQVKKLPDGGGDLTWARELCAMLQVSLLGYIVGGSFLGLAYFDLPYHLVALILLTRIELNRALAAREAEPQAVSRPAERLGSPRPIGVRETLSEWRKRRLVQR